MFKRKPIYIVLLIIFTLLLGADILAYSLTAGASSGMPARPDGFPQSAWPEVSSGTVPDADGDIESQTGGGGAPGNFDPSQMPGNFDSSQRPGNFDPSKMGDFDPSQMGDFDPSQMGDFDPSQMPGGFRGQGMPGGSASGFASFIGSWWIPIGILCVLVDAFCIFMLVRISKRRKSAPGEAAGEDTLEPEDNRLQLSGYEKRQLKRRRTIRIVVILLAALLVVVAGYFVARAVYMAQIEQESKVPVMSAQASAAEIVNVISGTGTLADAEALEITVPGGVEIASYSVENGNAVAEGDILATVDHTSVMKAIADLQDAMDVLNKKIEAASSEEIESKSTAPVNGRIKAVYAQAGTAVTDTMYENGALVLMSLDGLMATDIETDADIAAGDSVTVTLSDGTELAGRVASAAAGVATVTVSDEDAAYGEQVTVSDGSGNALGNSTLYIHSELKVIGFLGTAKKVNCSEGDKVSAGDTLLTLTETENTAKYQLLLQTRDEYEQEMLKLFKLYQDGNIYAEHAGTVSGIDEDNVTGYTAASVRGESAETQVVTADYRQTGYTGATSGAGNALGITALSASSVSSEQRVATLEYTAAQPSMVELGNNPTGADDATVEGYSNYVATVSSVSYGTLTLMQYPTSLTITDYSDVSSLGVTTDMMTAENKVSPASGTSVYRYENGVWSSYSMSDISAGDVIILTVDSSSGTDNIVWIVIVSKSTSGGDPGLGETPPGGAPSGGMSGGPADTETEKEEEETYEITETTVMYLMPSDAMSVSITVDELDVLSLKKGQEAVVTLDALTGRTFTGSVTSIDTAGTNSGGSTKFTGVVTLDKTEDMLAGMNASVSITLSKAQCTVTIPVAALVEKGGDVFVYTSCDEESSALGNPVSVTTGLSDGTSVEILSGLSSGDTVFYEYNDTVDISSSNVSQAGGGFNLMRMFGGGGRRG